ncbi:hypothetical protein ACK33C_04070 [Aeromonas hydrophila]|uniref:hypothetical protein n=1 Tax=Aeromonas hydrophila TaxID=644 RepID=UPI002B48B4A8|nr:hypothetical protein [Aeromonas hydrophila]
MTTTVFRKNANGNVTMASDSRVTWVNEDNIPIQWFDSTDFLKTLTIDDVMYGFAGTNFMFKMFLQNYTTVQQSEFVLDTLVSFAKTNRIQFFIIRFDGVALKLFAYSPPESGNPEILRTSRDPIIEKTIYAIGSGKYAKEFSKNKTAMSAQVPIRRIIAANIIGLKKSKVSDLDKVAALRPLTLEQSSMVYHACKSKGGDIFTGGEVNMTQHATQQQIKKQIDILDRMDQRAKAVGAVCASPVDATLEVKQLQLMGQYSVSPFKIESSPEREALLEKMKVTFQNSI